MRTYPRNSPEAAARIVALAMLSDGHLAKSELEVLERLDAARQLGLPPEELRAVVHGFCEDLLSSADAATTGACEIDERTLAELLAEIDDQGLRETVLHLCVAVVEADAHIHDGESMVLVSAVEHWGMHRAMLVAAPH